MIEREDFSEAAIARRLTHLLLAILLGFAAVSLALSYWSVVRTDALAARPDNPRTVEAELRVQRGSIVDRNNVILAENSGPNNRQERVYPIAAAGPAVGHYSLRFGTAGIEEAYDNVLRGGDTSAAAKTLAGFLHISPAGRDIRLTLDATLQETAARLMTGQQGALVLLELTGSDEQPVADIRALVSQPWYDPADLETLLADPDGSDAASLFNRATQGSYQPGLILLPLLAGTAIDQGLLDPAGLVSDADRGVSVSGVVQRCLTSPDSEEATWLDSVHWLCPGAAADLGEILGIKGLSDAFQALGFAGAPSIPIPVAEGVSPVVADVINAALGQEALTVSPLQVGLAYAGLAGTGEVPAVRLVDAIQSETGAWQSNQAIDTEAFGAPAMSASTASLVRRALPQENGISEVRAPVLSAPDGRMNEWYVGLSPGNDPRYVVVVVLEQPTDPDAAEQIGQSVLGQAQLQP